MSRQYQSEWNKLKSKVLSTENTILAYEGRLEIASPPRYHKTIVKALRKEKCLDSDFRFHTYNRQGLRYVLLSESDPTIKHLLIITLKVRQII